MVKDKVVVESSPTGGTIWVPLEEGKGMVTVSQRYTHVEKGKLRIETRYAQIIQGHDILKLDAGDILNGNIYIKESHMPLDYDDHEYGLAKNDDGTYEKIGDRYVWRYTLYSENEGEYDEILSRDTTASHQ